MSTASRYAYTLFARRHTGNISDRRAQPGNRMALDHFHASGLASRAFLWAIERQTIWNNGTGWHGEQHDLSWELYQYLATQPGDGRRVAISHPPHTLLNVSQHLTDDLAPQPFATLLTGWHTDFTTTTGAPAQHVPHAFTHVPTQGAHHQQGADTHGR